LVEVLVDFARDADLAAWRAVDDVVMGGVSQSRLQRTAPGVASFIGTVSLEHGGGFASVRCAPRDWSTDGASAFVLRCRGDGHRYKFTVRVDDGYDGVQYQARFEPPRDAWTDLELPLGAFAASFRGRPVPGAGPLDPARVRQLGLMISDRQAGAFELQLRGIAALTPALTRAARDLSRKRAR
jgi:NADH dehydrogenase [ubiquinone] 1 alpha subcomplex assembly factor 1